MADTVARLVRLRAAQEDVARREVAAALRAQAEAEASLAAMLRAMSQEAKTAETEAGHPLAGAYPVWLPSGQAAIRRAAMEEAARRGAVAALRLALTQARLASRACEILQDTQKAGLRDAALKAQQALIEEPRRRSAAGYKKS